MSTLPSASVLRYLSDKGAGAPPKTLVVGNPDLGAALALPWAEREARMVGQREPEATVLVRGDATEAHDYTAPPHMLSMEKSAEEVTWSYGTYMEPDEVWKAF